MNQTTYIYSIFLPRIELFYIEEWAQHHFNLGIKKIFLYHNGFKPIDNSAIGNNHPVKLDKNDSKNVTKWTKKPLEDYNLDLSDEQINQELEKIEDKFNGALNIKYWASEFSGPYPASQFKGYQDLRNNLRKMRKKCKGFRNPMKWLIIDVDEFLVLHKHQSMYGFLSRFKKFGAIHISSKIFQARNNRLPVRTIFDWGYESKLRKTIVVNKGTPRIKAHLSKSRIAKEFINIPREYAEIFHYRGIPWSGKAIQRDFPNKRLIRKLQREGPTEENIKKCAEIFSKKDFTMKRYL